MPAIRTKTTLPEALPVFRYVALLGLPVRLLFLGLATLVLILPVAILTAIFEGPGEATRMWNTGMELVGGDDERS